MHSYSYQRSDVEYPKANYAYSPSAIRYYAKYYPKLKPSHVDQNIASRNVNCQQPVYQESSTYNSTYANLVPNQSISCKQQQQINQNVTSATPVTYQNATAIPPDSVYCYIPVIYTRKIVPRYTVRPIQNQSVAIQAEQATRRSKKSINKKTSEESIFSDASEEEKIAKCVTKIPKTPSKVSSLYSLQNSEAKCSTKTSIFDETLSLKNESRSKTISTIYEAEKELVYESQSTQTQWTQTSSDLTNFDGFSQVGECKQNQPLAKTGRPFFAIVFSYIMRLLLIFPTNSFYSFLRQLVFIY